MQWSNICNSVVAFEIEAKKLLAHVETSKTRLITLEDSYKKVSGLSLKQEDLFKQALRCIEHELYRAAHVMAWAAFIDFLHLKLSEDGYVKINAKRPTWKVSGTEDLKEQADFHVIEAAKAIELLRRNEEKALKGLLNKRNECAHPEDYYPSLNDSLGYIDELLKRIVSLKNRTI